MTRTEPYVVRRPEQIRALASSARLEIVDALQTSGPASISEIARAMGRAADSLYYHVRILQKAGLLRIVDSRPRGRTREAVYDLPGRPLKVAYGLSDRRMRLGIVRLVASLLRGTQRDFLRATEDPSVEVEGPGRRLWAARLKGRVTRSQIRQINAYLQRIGAILTDQTKDRRNAELMSFTFVLLPVNQRSTTKRAVRSPARTPKEQT